MHRFLKLKGAFYLSAILMLFVSPICSAGPPTSPKSIPGKNADQRLIFIRSLSDADNPRRCDYYQLALRDRDFRIRDAGASWLCGEPERVVYLLLKTIVEDPDPSVVQSAAIQLSGYFTSTGWEEDEKMVYVRALEKNLSLFKEAMQRFLPADGHPKFLVNAAFSSWCSFTEKTQEQLMEFFDTPGQVWTHAGWALKYIQEHPCAEKA